MLIKIMDFATALYDGQGRLMRRVWALKHTKHFRKTYLQPALDAGLIEMTLPDKPHSRRQRYRLTPTGSAQRQRPAATG